MIIYNIDLLAKQEGIAKLARFSSLSTQKEDISCKSLSKENGGMGQFVQCQQCLNDITLIYFLLVIISRPSDVCVWVGSSTTATRRESTLLIWWSESKTEIFNLCSHSTFSVAFSATKLILYAICVAWMWFKNSANIWHPLLVSRAAGLTLRPNLKYKIK